MKQETPADNERFGASGAVTRLKVCADLEVLSPSERQWTPRLRQAATTLSASDGQRSGTMKRKFENE
jgi:hypothetical protein